MHQGYVIFYTAIILLNVMILIFFLVVGGECEKSLDWITMLHRLQMRNLINVQM